MAVDLKSELTEALRSALAAVAAQYSDLAIPLERPREAAHGDFATSLPLQLARALRRSPREIAQMLAAELPASPLIERAEAAGAGFLNLFVTAAAKREVVRRIAELGDDYGRAKLGGGKRVLLEFVSANPTGPLHVGHGRGAAYGASLANILEFAGWSVTREFYVNDAGRQMDILALSTWLRYLELRGEAIDFPPNAYRGDYVRDMALRIEEAHGSRYVREAGELAAGTPGLPGAERDDPEAEARREAHLDALIANAKRLLGDDWAYFHQFALTEQLADAREDLAEFGVRFDHWFSERSLFETGMVERAVETLAKAGHVYLQDGARWFRATEFGDEKDRVLQRENGQYTYFASDIAYHLNKYERGFERMIDVWGADHHGYIPRVKAALGALGLDAGRLTVALVQFAVLYRNGQKTSMSTRAGEFVTLRELREEVGNDAARFFYVLRKSDQHLDFDLDLAKSESSDNPVYYVQYAHARVCSVLSQWGGDAEAARGFDPGALATARELALCRRLADFPDTVEEAARSLAPHAIAFYLRDLAAEFHAWYNAERILVEDEAVRGARLALSLAVKSVLASGLRLLGVSAPSAM
ncbi:MAG: arginine--tRNA ligase [Rhodocyclaceae bacterium]